MKEKIYEFSSKGLSKAIADTQSEKIGKYVDIGFWGLMGVLVLGGVMSQGALIKMLACTGTSKIVRMIMG